MIIKYSDRKIPITVMSIYVVNPGDTLDQIAALYGADPLSISYDNQIPYPYSLTPGEALYIGDQNPAEPSQREIRTGGYAYPFISRYVLQQTLPWLSDLYIFSYGFTEEGDLVFPNLPDGWMISLAKEYGTAPILTLAPFGPDGRFNNYLISRIVQQKDSRDRLIGQIRDQIIDRGFEGVDIDFEYILAEDRDGFTDFVREVRSAVGELGFPVSVALAPKTSADQQGLLYEGKDYPALGAAADYVLLMTYEWGYTYGPPMAVAPIRNVRQVVEYALTEIPAEKINMGIPNYGYDWPLPFIKGETRAMTLGSIEVRQRAVQYGVPIRFDQTAASPSYTYRLASGEHEVWFEDVRSLEAKFSLIREFGLGGAGYWNIMNLFRANWLLLDSFFSG